MTKVAAKEPEGAFALGSTEETEDFLRAMLHRDGLLGAHQAIRSLVGPLN